jgi:hypothetical protein
MTNAQTHTADRQAIELGFTHKVIELDTGYVFFPVLVTCFRSEQDARAFAATRPIGRPFKIAEL